MRFQLHKLTTAAFAAAAILQAVPSVAGEQPKTTSSLLPMFLADNATAERRIVHRIIAGEDPGSQAVREEASNLRLLQADILVLGYVGDLPALDAASERDVGVRILVHRAGLDGVDPWSILAGRTLAFQRSRE